MAKRKIIGRVIFCFLVPFYLAKAGSAEEYYSEKTIKIIVGLSAGGGFDTYARTIARHMGKHIPGNPKFIVVNMPGAGSMNAVNHLYNKARPDGLTIGTFLGHVVLKQIFDQSGVRFDAHQFRWLGIPAPRTGACALRTASGITDLEKWKAATKPVHLGNNGIATASYITAKFLKDVVGLPVDIVSGYRGSSEFRLAADKGEIDGACWQWESIKPTWRYALDAKDVVIVLQFGREPHPDLPHVPLASSLIKSDDARSLLRAGIASLNSVTTAYALPPNTPEKRVAILRNAFMATMKDADFLAEAKKARLAIRPIDGKEMEKMIEEYFDLKPALREKLRKIIYGK